MLIERYEPEKHKAVLDGWVRARKLGQDIGDPDLLPSFGLFVDRTACGFLWETDSKQAYMGAIFADPAATRPRRAEALLILIEQLCMAARARGYHAVVGLPTVPALVAKFKQLGFVTVPGEYAIRRV